jgi:hypothetical protein
LIEAFLQKLQKEIENRKRKRKRREQKNREGPRGEPFGPEVKAAHGPVGEHRTGTPPPLSLPLASGAP